MRTRRPLRLARERLFRRFGVLGRAPLWVDLMQLIVAWLCLSAFMNLRYPAPEPSFGYLTPSLDVSLLFAAFAVLGLYRIRLPRWPLFGLAALVSFVRLFRVADGVALGMQQRELNLFIDAQLLPDLVRLAYTTLPTARLLGLTLGGTALLVAIGYVAYRLMALGRRLLMEPRRALAFSALMASLLATRALIQGGVSTSQTSVVPRVADDFTRYWEARAFPEQARLELRARQASENQSGLLAELTGSNVLLIFIESYGETVLELDHYKSRIQAAYQEWESSLAPHGFHIASSLLESPTVGGYSWLAHLTLASGIRVTDQVRYKKLYAMKPKTIVNYFVDAGYETLIVQPATMQDPGPLIYPFTRRRYSWEFGYQGRNFSWAPMPDQFALDFVYRHEIAPQKRPLFVEYNLVSGHMPWNDQAPVVPWEQIKNGALYRNMPGIRFDTDWSRLTHAHEAYLTAMLYDLEVLRQYLERFVHDDTLVIFLGDHQPVGEVTNHTWQRGVPIHVVSRNPRFVAKFLERGYTPGMHPKAKRPYPGMETFLPNFVDDFSRR